MPHAREGVGELIVSTAIKSAAGDNVIALTAQRHDRHRLCRVTRAGRQRTDATFECRQALLEDIGSRVHDAGINVAEFFEREQVGRVFRIAKLIAVV